MMRRRVVVLVAGIVVLISAAYGVFLFSKSRTTQLFGELVARVETQRAVVALTFDDGPSAQFTQDILALLKDRNVKATFFLTGKEIEENLLQAQAIVAAGHEIGNHSYSHPDMTLMGLASVASEIERTDAAIRAAGHQGDIHFRPPFGKKLFALPWYLSENDRKTIMWDVEPETYPDVTINADLFTDHVLEQTKSGSIILMHLMYRSREVSRQALPKIIDGLRARGFEFATVSQLMKQ